MNKKHYKLTNKFTAKVDKVVWMLVQLGVQLVCKLSNRSWAVVVAVELVLCFREMN